MKPASLLFKPSFIVGGLKIDFRHVSYCASKVKFFLVMGKGLDRRDSFFNKQIMCRFLGDIYLI